MSKAKDTKAKTVYYDPDEWKKIEANAARAKMRTATYIRKIAVEGKIMKFDLSRYETLVYFLRGLAAATNEIARTVNTTGEITAKDIEDLKSMQDDLDEVSKTHFTGLNYTLLQ